MADSSNHHTCKNCGQDLRPSAKFCSSCGQKTKSSMLSFWTLFRDFFDTIFSLDSKVVRTIPVLLFRPGKLTQEYVNGRRVRYLPPVRMYVFFSLLMFLMIPFFYSFDGLKPSEIPDTKELRDSLLQDILQDTVHIKGDRTTINFDPNSGANWSFQPKSRRDLQAFFNVIDSTKAGIDIDKSIEEQFAHKSGFVQLVIKKSILMYQYKGAGMSAVLIKTLSYSLFLFLPIFALLLKLLYVRRKRLYAEHFVFSLHFLSFIFFLFILNMLMHSFNQEWFVFLVVFCILIYLFFAMRRVYGQGTWKTLLKYVLLMLATTIFLIPFFALLILFGAFLLY